MNSLLGSYQVTDFIKMRRKKYPKKEEDIDSRKIVSTQEEKQREDLG